jgi:hypothetical protein
MNTITIFIIAHKEFYPKRSKSVIDEIDDVLANHYGFSSTQRIFIKTFDKRFRMGEEEAQVIRENAPPNR